MKSLGQLLKLSGRELTAAVMKLPRKDKIALLEALRADYDLEAMSTMDFKYYLQQKLQQPRKKNPLAYPKPKYAYPQKGTK